VEADRIVARIRALREDDYDSLANQIRAQFQAIAQDQSGIWLVRALAMELPASQLLPLAGSGEVVYIQPRFAGEGPPQVASNGNPADNVIKARLKLNTDPYVASYGSGKIGLVDTGVYSTHDLLHAPDRVGECWDCVMPTCTLLPSVDEVCPTDFGHGTGTAALLAGNASLGDDFRGITAGTVDVYRSYYQDPEAAACSAIIDGVATVHAIQMAVQRLDRVILVETQSTSPGWAAIAQEADQAYRAGSLVIAPDGQGKDPPGYPAAGAPANARGAIGIGSYDVRDESWDSMQKYGLCEGRLKPDLEAPTSCETASAKGMAELTPLTGTSGAGPMVAAASLLLRNFMRGSSVSIDPGKVYAALILCGDRVAPFAVEHGAGHLSLMPADRLLEWGKIELHANTGRLIPIQVSDPNASVFAAAIWWPENLEFNAQGYTIDVHDNVDLEVIPPSSSTPAASSSSVNGVFERAVAPVAGRAGVWKLRILATDFAKQKQTVFWAVGIGPSQIMSAPISHPAAACGCSPPWAH
jgi:hypothetical protein